MDRRINALLVYPRYTDTFWSFRFALNFISRKAGFPPLGLLTVAALLPPNWNLRLIDLNVKGLKKIDLLWADYVFISAMEIQEKSAREVIGLCYTLHKPVVAGGPLFTARPDDFPLVDHFVLNEAEVTLPAFLSDLSCGKADKFYKANGEWAEMDKSPLPRWDLLNINDYATLSVQFSRGCPNHCEFCDITYLYGRRMRSKTASRLSEELEIIYQRGYKGKIFIVDDNFIGNRQYLKNEVLPALISWSASRNFPFHFITQATVDLADDEILLDMLISARFDSVFIGLETPEDSSLLECGKVQNRKRNLLLTVRKIQQKGLEVMGGFIVGFDHDPPSIFDSQIRFIQESAIVTAMVGLLHVLPNTLLHRRMKEENRLLSKPTGDNMDYSLNFKPRMAADKLIAGYNRLLKTIYSPVCYYARVKQFLHDYNPPIGLHYTFNWQSLTALLKSVVLLGIISKSRIRYWHIFMWSLFFRRKLFPLAITYAIYGYHFRKIIHFNEKHLNLTPN